jgi:hypothetical protein
MVADNMEEFPCVQSTNQVEGGLSAAHAWKVTDDCVACYIALSKFDGPSPPVLFALCTSLHFKQEH